MYVDPELIRKRAASPSNLTIKHRSMNREGKSPLDHETKVFLGTMARASGHREVERQFGELASQAAISNFAMGITSVPKGVDKKLQKDVEEASQSVTDKVSERATNTLTAALGLVDDRLSKKDQAAQIKTVDIARIAKDMSTIHNNMTPKNQLSGPSFGMQIVIHAPVQKTVRDFDAIVD